MFGFSLIFTIQIFGVSPWRWKPPFKKVIANPHGDLTYSSVNWNFESPWLSDNARQERWSSHIDVKILWWGVPQWWTSRQRSRVWWVKIPPCLSTDGDINVYYCNNRMILMEGNHPVYQYILILPEIFAQYIPNISRTYFQYVLHPSLNSSLFFLSTGKSSINIEWAIYL